MIGIFLVGTAVFSAVFYRNQLRGIWPAAVGPAGDIAELIEENDIPLDLPEGFSISIFAKDLINPRVMTYDPGGNIIASITSQGRVVALPDRDGDGKADETIVLLEGLNRPHGLAVRCAERCEFYVAETDKVVVYDYEFDAIKKIHQPVNGRKIIDLPGGGGHFTRTLFFMPEPNDHKLLTSVGSSCNVCEESDWRRAKILISNADGGDLKEYARGLRNSVFMAIHPVDGKIWATEMGRDWLGDDLPPDEINILKEGGNYGWPICYGKNIHDTEFDKNVYVRNPCMEPFEKPSHIDIPAHSAPLGLAFFPEEGWPQEYWYNALVAYHGSWNRSAPTGYKVVRYKLDYAGNYLGEEDLITGWLKDGKASGRPADILIQPGGTIFISDDSAGVIYKIIYRRPDYSKMETYDLIRNVNIKESSAISSPVKITGEARGFWYFEASFPVRLLDGNGKEIAVKPAQAKSDPADGGAGWMTENFVPFEAELEFSKPATKNGFLVLQKDNPSGLPEHDRELRIPVRFK